ncbi:MAG: Pyruvate/ketoisovalerate oxidoreductase [Clostridia bacterium 62_21]|nr:MAG: Pyruvate/ketoisovalerate oxidoreductase [Clostridia bacterium 62_21]HAG07446.1 2-oxoacid:ferredoxin oxidoreductase subunit gamma [Peptococcaceae bacterium]
MLWEILLAGFGGQGILLAGQLIAYAGLRQGKHVAWIPSYGPEMRGGTANCSVTVADEPISCPLVTEPLVLIAMNQPSLEKFETAVVPGGLVLYNRSLINRTVQRRDVRALDVPANALAEELGNVRVASMVLVGAFIGATGAVSLEAAREALADVLPPRRHNLLPVNREALGRGAAIGARCRWPSAGDGAGEK